MKIASENKFYCVLKEPKLSQLLKMRNYFGSRKDKKTIFILLDALQHF